MNNPSSSRFNFLLVQGVTLLRIPLALVLAGLLAYDSTSTTVLITATILLAIMEISDGIDGFLARRLNVVSESGALLDPYADSVARITVYWALASANLTYMAVPWTMAFRDISVAYCRIIWARRGISGSARLSGKIKAVVQGAAAFFLLLSPSLFPAAAPTLKVVFSILVVVATLASLVEYLSSTKAR